MELLFFGYILLGVWGAADDLNMSLVSVIVGQDLATGKFHVIGTGT
jgi:hypothetical protein